MMPATFSGFRVPSDMKEEPKNEVLYKLTTGSENKKNYSFSTR